MNNNSNPQDGEEMSPEDRSKKRREFQRDITMLDSDYRKKVNEKTLIESETRKYKKQESQIRMDMQTAQEKLKKLDQEIMMMEVQMRGMKKKMNLI